MPFAFIELDGKDGHVLLPTSTSILAIRQETQDTPWFWIECVYAPFENNPQHVEKKSFCVRGPKDYILTQLSAQTTGADPELRKQVKLTEAHNERLALELQSVKQRFTNLKLDHDARLRLDQAPGQWDDPKLPTMSAPSLWSSYRLHSMMRDERQVRLFAAAQGNEGQGFEREYGRMTKALTNMKESGRVPLGQMITCFALKFEFLRGHEDDVAALKTNGTLAWDFLSTTVDICPLGAMTWSDDGRTGYWKFASSDAGKLEGAQLNEPVVAVRAPVARDPKSFGVLPSVPQHNPSNLFRFGGASGVQIPGNTSFSILLQGIDAIPYKGDDVVVRVTLAINSASQIEIG